jgi:putative SOS response-associated peptidase YedK
MCGRYTLTADLKKVADRFGAPMPEEEHLNAQPRKGFGASSSTDNTPRSSERIGDWDEERTRLLRPRYNIAPTQAVIVVGDDGKRRRVK